MCIKTARLWNKRVAGSLLQPFQARIVLYPKCFLPVWSRNMGHNISTISITPFQAYISFLDALASLKTMIKIKSLMFSRFCHLQSITEYYRVLQSITEYCRVLQRIAEYYRVLQGITEYYRVLQNITEYYRVLQSITEY